MIQYNFNKKTAVVTGATKGIGRSIAFGLLKAQARVVLTYSADEASAQEVESCLKENKFTDYLLLKSDVSNRDNIRFMLQAAEEKWAQPISYIINNAGVLKQGDFLTLSDEQWDWTFKINLKGPFMLCQEYLKRNCYSGAIVNIASVGGQVGGDKAPDYATAKAGLISLTRSLARIGGKSGIRVNAVSPGWIETPIFSKDRLEELKQEAKENILLGRLGQTEEVASAVLFLLSDAASYITGHCLNVNGGMYFG
jgi:NAD(P)-dependent dehydrogenase (short-subunit alcohol dehydrogenase family)